ncbi:hypothetical protein ACSW9O_16095 (plasmid) [Clostridium perfringens]
MELIVLKKENCVEIFKDGSHRIITYETNPSLKNLSIEEIKKSILNKNN